VTTHRAHRDKREREREEGVAESSTNTYGAGGTIARTAPLAASPLSFAVVVVVAAAAV
jgi:hypothetical protein